MEKEILEGKLFVEAYKNIVDSINELDVEDKTEEINREIESLKELEKPDDYLMEHSENRRDDYELTEYLVDDIKKQEEKIIELKKAQEKVSENKGKVQFLDERRQTVRKNLKNNKENGIKNRENAIKSIEQRIENIKNAKIEMQEKQVGSYRKELAEIEESEKRNPNKARDKRYKEYLRSKIDNELEKLDFSGMDLQIKECEDQMQNLQKEIKTINVEYREILKNFGRIDRGESIKLEKTEKTKSKKEHNSNDENNGNDENNSNAENDSKETIISESEIKNINREVNKNKEDDAYEIDEIETNEIKNKIESKIENKIENNNVEGHKVLPEIRIGRKVTIVDGARTPQKIGGLRMLSKEDCVERYSEAIGYEVDNDFAEQIRKMDPVLVNTLIDVLDKDELQMAMNNLTNNDIKAFKEMSKFNIVYDLEDLSKGAFLPWNKSRRQTAKYGIEYTEKGLVGKLGEYEPNPIKRMFNKVKMQMLGNNSNVEKKEEAKESESTMKEKVGEFKEKFKSEKETKQPSINEVLKIVNERMKEETNTEKEQEKD